MLELDRNIRLTIYEHFVSTGLAPTHEFLAEAGSCSVEDVAASLSRLERDHHALSLAPSTTNIWMAHPFSAVPTAFRVESEGVSHWANCAWDAVAIPALLNLDATVRAACAESAQLLELVFKNGELIDNAGASGVIHFAVPPRRFWDNVGYT